LLKWDSIVSQKVGNYYLHIIMGCKQSSEPTSGPDYTPQIERNLKDSEKTSKTAKKLLLLGTGSSGKSTLFKSLKIITNDTNVQTEQSESRHVIRQNCVAGILTLLKKSQELYDADPHANEGCLVKMQDNIVEAIQLVVNYGSESFSDVLDDEEVQQLGESIRILWELEATQETFKRRGNTYSFPDNMDYFFGRVTAIMSRDYRPSTEDSLKCRVRTTGMIEYKYDIKENVFILYDVGGQRNERKKWIHHFADVAAVLFVCALNHYHAVLFEDEKKNALHEAIELFTEICNSKWFRKSEMILFLNKDDLFKEKIRAGISLSECFSPEKGWQKDKWTGEFDYESTRFKGDEAKDKNYFDGCHQAAIKFIQDAFMEVNNNQSRVIFCHVTCATDQETVQKVFWDVQNIVIRSNLRRGGLLV